ncbi:hypothetical protein [Spiroplasma sp. SV19]|uniref:hypothetical protein n=1 Tax=Spiroplasma sp. SV19 TaxID=2570468 RepID=UPI0024B6706B|nr:hypothetical protein [Spiroplasma sp. SV19]WHQ37531.1 hypothetical protein E7Y35_06780 [Spiroplasma sp. SV19]
MQKLLIFLNKFYGRKKADKLYDSLGKQKLDIIKYIKFNRTWTLKQFDEFKKMDDKLFQCFEIYAIFTLNPFRVYVGQTKDSFYDRIKEHYKSLWKVIHQLNGRKFKQDLANSVPPRLKKYIFEQKYGIIDKLQISILIKFPKNLYRNTDKDYQKELEECLIELEQHYIEMFKATGQNGFNSETAYETGERKDST